MLSVCPHFLWHNTTRNSTQTSVDVPDVSLCVQDLYVSGALLLCAVFTTVNYFVRYAWEEKTTDTSTALESATEGLLGPVAVKGETDLPSIDYDPDAPSPNPHSALRWQVPLLQGCTTILALGYLSLSVVNFMRFARGDSREEVITIHHH